MVLSTDERIFLVEHVFREGGNYTHNVKGKFSDKFPHTPVPHRNAVRKLIEKFRESGSVEDTERSGRPSKLSGQKLLSIMYSVLQNPRKPMRKLAQQHEIGVGTAHKAVRQTMQLLDSKTR